MRVRLWPMVRNDKARSCTRISGRVAQRLPELIGPAFTPTDTLKLAISIALRQKPHRRDAKHPDNRRLGHSANLKCTNTRIIHARDEERLG